jgi:DNA-binding transcriptional ArsR family regulator
MHSQFAYALAADPFDGASAPEPTVVDEVRVLGRVGGGARVQSTSAGIRGLTLAVLEDGIRSFLSTSRTRRDEAEAWMTMREQNWPFSFVNVCMTLGLEPSAVRQALRVMRERNGTRRVRLSRSRPNVRRKGRIRLDRRDRRRQARARQAAGE